MYHRSTSRGFTLIELLVVIAIIGVLIGLLFAAVQRVRDSANRARCTNNLRQVGLALHHYHDAHAAFAPGVSVRGGADPHPFMAWSARLLPYLEQDNLWKVTLQAYAKDRVFLNNPPHVGFATVILLYSCPADGRTSQVGLAQQGLPVAFTSYLGVSGSNQFRKDGVLYLDSKVRLTEVTDGASNTLAVGERPPSANGIFGWWYAGWGQSKDGSGDMVLSVRERNVSIYAPGCPLGPYEFGPGQITNQCDLFHFWSPHIGGAHFLFADGSTRFLSYSAVSVMPALATRAGGESVQIP